MPSIIWLLPLAVSAALLVILATAASNAWQFPRLGARRGTRFGGNDLPVAAFLSTAEPHTPTMRYSQPEPAVSVLIPARNESRVIGDTVTRLLAQSYPKLQVTVLDDCSDDATAQVAWAVAGQATNYHLLCGQPLPSGWLGKNWACHQLAKHAIAQQAEILIFSDADVQWQPQAVAAVVAEMQRSHADLLTVWPTQTTVAWGERLTVPLMALAVLGYLPVRLAHDFYHPLAAAANGQCMAFTRQAYERIGGHAAVRGAVIEDVQLAQRIKAAGLRLRMADGNRLIGCRMYVGSQAALDGFSKNILAGHGNRVWLLLLSTLFHWMIFVWPWLWLMLGGAWLLQQGLPPVWPLWPLLLVLAGVGARAITAAATKQRVGDALLMPLSVLLMTWIALRALWWRWRLGGVLWKGRILRDA